MEEMHGQPMKTAQPLAKAPQAWGLVRGIRQGHEHAISDAYPHLTAWESSGYMAPRAQSV